MCPRRNNYTIYLLQLTLQIDIKCTQTHTPRKPDVVWTQYDSHGRKLLPLFCVHGVSSLGIYGCVCVAAPATPRPFGRTFQFYDSHNVIICPTNAPMPCNCDCANNNVFAWPLCRRYPQFCSTLPTHSHSLSIFCSVVISL